MAPTSNLEPPTLSEVIRRLEALSQDVKNQGKAYVSTEIYVLDKQSHNREVQELRERVTALEHASDAREARVQEQAAKNRQFLIGIIAGPFIGALVGWITAGGLAP